jgi:hypothetical protein
VKPDSLKPIRQVPEAVWLAREEPAKLPIWASAARELSKVPKPIWAVILVTWAVFTVSVLFTPGVFGFYSLAAFAAAVVGSVAYLQWKGIGEGDPEPNRLDKLVADTGLEGGYQVSLAIYRDGVGTGFDEGVVLIQDGILRYYGLQTSFRLSSALVHSPANRYENGPFERDPKAGIPLGDHSIGRSNGFVLRDQGNVEVLLFSLEEGERERQFHRQLYKWLIGPTAPADNSILPPLEPQPEMKPKRSKAAVVATLASVEQKRKDRKARKK